MASEIQVANSALIAMGEKRVTAIDSSSETGRVMVDQFAISRDALMRVPLEFRDEARALAADADAPAWGFDYQYALPPDFLALDMVNDVYVGLRHERLPQQRHLGIFARRPQHPHQHLAPLKVRYIRQVIEAGTGMRLRRCARAALARDCCEKITQSTSKKEGDPRRPADVPSARPSA
jgi:hypothetical protein